MWHACNINLVFSIHYLLPANASFLEIFGVRCLVLTDNLKYNQVWDFLRKSVEYIVSSNKIVYEILIFFGTFPIHIHFYFQNFHPHDYNVSNIEKKTQI